MNKRIYLTAAIAVSVGLTTNDVSATTRFFDDFEDEIVNQIPSQWQNYYFSDSGTNYVTNQYASSGTQSLHVQSYPYSQKAVYAPYTYYEGDSVLTFDFYLPSASTDSRIGGLSYMGVGTNFRYNASTGTGEAFLNDSSQYPTLIGNIAAEQWHTATVEIDWNASTYTLDINGNSVTESFSKNTTESGNIIAVGSNWPTGPNTMYFDDVKLEEVNVENPPIEIIGAPEQYIELYGTITNRVNTNMPDDSNFAYSSDRLGLSIEEDDQFSISWKYDPNDIDDFSLQVNDAEDFFEPTSAGLSDFQGYSDVVVNGENLQITAAYTTHSTIYDVFTDHNLSVQMNLPGILEKQGFIDMGGFNGSGSIVINNTINEDLPYPVSEEFYGNIGSARYVYYAADIHSSDIDRLLARTNDSSYFDSYIEDKGKKFKEAADFVTNVSKLKDIFSCLFGNCSSNPVEDKAWEQVGKVGDAAYVCQKEPASDKQDCVLRFITSSPSLITFAGAQIEGIEAISFDYMGFNIFADDIMVVSLNGDVLLAIQGSDILGDWNSVFLPIGRELTYRDTLTIGLISDFSGRELNIRNFEGYTVPEPGSILLVLIGLLGFGLSRQDRVVS